MIAHRGYCIITVPAWPFLWSERDVRLKHKRRYTKQTLMTEVEASGFEVIKCSYFSVFYFPLLAALTLSQKWSRSAPRIDTDIASVPSVINQFLIAILKLESFLLRWINYPIGVSLLCVAQKRCVIDTEDP